MDSLNIAKIILSWATFTGVGIIARLFPLIALIIAIAFIGSIVGVSMAITAIDSMTGVIADVFNFVFVVATQNLWTVIAALVGFVGGASFIKRSKY